MLKNTSTKQAKKIWEDVDKSSRRCPEWIKSHLDKVCKETVDKLNRKQK